MLKNLFNKKNDLPRLKELHIFNSIEGRIICIEDIPDEVFARKILGDGFAIIPNDNRVYSPVSGEVKLLFPTLHAVAIETEEGIELLVNIGIDTVKLDGEGFMSHIKVGDVPSHLMLII